MVHNKTRPTDQAVTNFIARLPENQQADAKVLISIMQSVSGEVPVMWGKRIVGFGRYHYKYQSGREGDWMRTGFAPGVGKFSLYLTCDAAELKNNFQGLGKYKTGKGCIYINKLADVDVSILKMLIKKAYEKENPYT